MGSPSVGCRVAGLLNKGVGSRVLVGSGERDDYSCMWRLCLPPMMIPPMTSSCHDCLACSLYKVHEEDGKPFELEMTWICEESNRVHQKVRQAGR